MRLILAIVLIAVAIGIAAPVMGVVIRDGVGSANATHNLSEYSFLKESFELGPILIWLAIFAAGFYIVWQWYTHGRQHRPGGR